MVIFYMNAWGRASGRRPARVSFLDKNPLVNLVRDRVQPTRYSHLWWETRSWI